MAIATDIAAAEAKPPDDGEIPLSAYFDEPQVRANGHGAAKHTDGVEPFTVRRLDQIDAQSRPAVVQGLGFDEAAVAAVVGAPNAGKTAFAVSLALAVASRATSWMGLKVAGGPAVYFGAEAPGSVKMRGRAALARLEPGARGVALYVSEAAPALGGELTAHTDAERMLATVAAVQALEGERVRMVLVDTLASCLGDGDENGEGMLRLVGAAKHLALRTSACVVLLHHPSKGDSAGLRGHGSLSAACDSILRIDVEELSGVRTATLMKARDHATGLQLRFELEAVALPERDSFGDPCTTIVVRPSTQAAPRPRPSGKRQEQLLAELERRYRTGERQWDEASICKAGRDLGMHRNSPRDALRGLTKAGYLSGTTAGYNLKHAPEDPS
jgi:Mrp family chromosome partitioning ATPase